VIVIISDDQPLFLLLEHFPHLQKRIFLFVFDQLAHVGICFKLFLILLPKSLIFCFYHYAFLFFIWLLIALHHLLLARVEYHPRNLPAVEFVSLLSGKHQLLFKRSTDSPSAVQLEFRIISPDSIYWRLTDAHGSLPLIVATLLDPRAVVRWKLTAFMLLWCLFIRGRLAQTGRVGTVARPLVIFLSPAEKRFSKIDIKAIDRAQRLQAGLFGLAPRPAVTELHLNSYNLIIYGFIYHLPTISHKERSISFGAVGLNYQLNIGPVVEGACLVHVYLLVWRPLSWIIFH
jgi:hypothetical protein